VSARRWRELVWQRLDSRGMNGELIRNEQVFVLQYWSTSGEWRDAGITGRDVADVQRQAEEWWTPMVPGQLRIISRRLLEIALSRTAQHDRVKKS
jgi:hypothetical protein